MVVSPAAKALGEAYHIKCHPDWRSFTPQTTNQSLVAIHPLSLSLSLLEPQPPETPLSYLLLLLLPLPPRKKKGWSHPALLDYTRSATTAVPAANLWPGTRGKRKSWRRCLCGMWDGEISRVKGSRQGRGGD